LPPDGRIESRIESEMVIRIAARMERNPELHEGRGREARGRSQSRR
jgi:hypothetical protein